MVQNLIFKSRPGIVKKKSENFNAKSSKTKFLEVENRSLYQLWNKSYPKKCQIEKEIGRKNTQEKFQDGIRTRTVGVPKRTLLVNKHLPKSFLTLTRSTTLSSFAS